MIRLLASKVARFERRECWTFVKAIGIVAKGMFFTCSLSLQKRLVFSVTLIWILEKRRGNDMNYVRMLDADHTPSESDMLAAIGETELWLDLKGYLEQYYDFLPELIYYGKKYGWTIRYRKSGKTLISLFPEQGAFTALVVLGKKEAEKVARKLAELSPATRKLLGSEKQLHDGKWLWIRVLEPLQVEDIKLLLTTKRKPIAKASADES